MEILGDLPKTICVYNHFLNKISTKYIKYKIWKVFNLAWIALFHYQNMSIYLQMVILNKV